MRKQKLNAEEWKPQSTAPERAEGIEQLKARLARQHEAVIELQSAYNSFNSNRLAVANQIVNRVFAPTAQEVAAGRRGVSEMPCVTAEQVTLLREKAMRMEAELIELREFKAKVLSLEPPRVMNTTT